MSGGTGSGRGGGFGGDSGTDCSALRFDVFLSSVNPDALGSFEKDDRLRIELRTTPTRVLVVVLSDGTVVGAIAQRVRELLRCIQQGVEYWAMVKNISDGDVEVRVEPV
jgi:hypothetical protein